MFFFLNLFMNFHRGFGGLIPNRDGDGKSPIIFIGDWGRDGDEKWPHRWGWDCHPYPQLVPLPSLRIHQQLRLYPATVLLEPSSPSAMVPSLYWSCAWWIVGDRRAQWIEREHKIFIVNCRKDKRINRELCKVSLIFHVFSKASRSCFQKLQIVASQNQSLGKAIKTKSSIWKLYKTP